MESFDPNIPIYQQFSKVFYHNQTHENEPPSHKYQEIHFNVGIRSIALKPFAIFLSENVIWKLEGNYRIDIKNFQVLSTCKNY